MSDKTAGRLNLVEVVFNSILENLIFKAYKDIYEHD